MKNRKNQLRKQIRELQNELSDIEFSERDEKNKGLINRHFKYRNCYSVPQTEKDYWWLYRKVVGVSEGMLEVIDFQIDQYGKIDIEPSKTTMSVDGWVEIDIHEFSKAWDKTMKSITNIKFFGDN